MAMRSSTKKPKKGKPKKQPIERAFFRVFQSAKRKLELKSDPIDALKDRMWPAPGLVDTRLS